MLYCVFNHLYRPPCYGSTAQHSQFTASSVPLPSSLCQLTIAKSLQDNQHSQFPSGTFHRRQPEAELEGQMSKQVGRVAMTVAGVSHFHIHAATAPSSGCSEFRPFGNSSSGWEGRQKRPYASHFHTGTENGMHLASATSTSAVAAAKPPEL